jgi:hypothetical protein
MSVLLLCVQDSQLLLAKTGAHLRNVLDTQVMVAAHQLLNHAEFKGTTVWGGCGHKLADVGGGWPNKAGLAKLMQVRKGNAYESAMRVRGPCV